MTQEAAATIYVVEGETGEYSGSYDWLVRAFRTEAEARAHVEFLTAKWQELGPGNPKTDHEQRQAAVEAMRAFDPQFNCEYTGASWRVRAVPFDGGQQPDSPSVVPGDAQP